MSGRQVGTEVVRQQRELIALPLSAVEASYVVSLMWILQLAVWLGPQRVWTFVPRFLALQDSVPPPMKGSSRGLLTVHEQ